ncbi:MAG TPA: endospore germination permease [Bacillota bacterium]|nr:endospore germination permease [Bacillota bacterium]
MSKEFITERQGLAMMVLFLIGSTLVVGVTDVAKQDSWLSVLLAIITALPILMVYARLLHLFPGKDLFTITHQVFGPVAGKIISLLFVWYTFHLGVLVIRNFSEFLSEISLPETPQYFIQLVMLLLCIWIVKGGIEVLGRWTSFVFNIIILIIIALIPMALAKFNLTNFTPFLYEGFRPVMDGAFAVFSFPLAETVVFLSVLSFLKPGASGYKVYYLSLFVGGGILLFIVLRNATVLGFPFLSTQYFPTYIAVSLINMGEFFRRFEVMVAVVFLLCGFVKVSVCLFGAATGIARIFNIDDYRILTVPVALLMINLSIIIYPSMQAMFEWIKVYKYYAIPFQVILPLMIWIGAEIKIRMQKKTA